MMLATGVNKAVLSRAGISGTVQPTVANIILKFQHHWGAAVMESSTEHFHDSG